MGFPDVTVFTTNVWKWCNFITKIHQMILKIQFSEIKNHFQKDQLNFVRNKPNFYLPIHTATECAAIFPLECRGLRSFIRWFIQWVKMVQKKKPFPFAPPLPRTPLLCKIQPAAVRKNRKVPFHVDFYSRFPLFSHFCLFRMSSLFVGESRAVK